MDGLENVRAVRESSSIDRWLAEQPQEPTGAPSHPLDSPEAHKTQTRLLEWYNQEREKQAANRYQMAIDQDYYDNLQWSDEDIAELEERGQAPYTFNECAPTVDWVIGTEKRTRVDFKVLPRTEDDVQLAETKTKVLKWNSDVNKTAFCRSLAFADSAKVGLGWLEDGARGDPTEEPLFSRYENWRYIIHDSSGVERDTSDMRYLFRVKWLDLDIGKAMFRGKRNASMLEQAAVTANLFGSEEEEDFWYLGQHYQSRDAQGQVIGRRTFLSDSSLVFNRRARVKLIEAWYREPERCWVCRGEIFHGERFDRKNTQMVEAYHAGALSLYDQLKLTVRCAIMTEGHLLQDIASPYKHNRFPFTPIWCYRRGRDGAPYGIIRRIRDPQDDLNKRHSKALFILSVNRVIADHDAVEDHEEAREEAARPDAYIIKKRGAEFKIENQENLAEEHLMMMDRDARMIRQSGGVTDDNLGRQTNAISGEAIKARQLQGSVVTAEIFDNLRFAVQNQGEIQLSLAEQFMTEPKVIRLTQARGQIDWVKINQPEYDANGELRFVNDITASKADFIVDQQDFHQSVRQAMFESMIDLVGKVAAINTEYALRLLRMALEFSDLPNKDEMAADIKKMLGIVDPGDVEKMSPEQKQALQQQEQQKQAEAALQQRAAELAVAEQDAKVKKLNAEADKVTADAERLRAEAQSVLRGDGANGEAARAEFERKVQAIETRAAAAMDKARSEIEDLRAEARNRAHEIGTQAMTEHEVARVQAAAQVREAEIAGKFEGQMKELSSQVADLQSELKQAERERERMKKDAERQREKDRKAQDQERERAQKDRERMAVKLATVAVKARAGTKKKA